MAILGRLKRRPDFLRVAARGRKQAAAGLVLQAYRRPPSDDASPAERATADAETVRLGFTATKKVGGAVARNRARRRLREAARLVLPQRARAGFDLVLVARQGTLDRPFAALVADLERALERTGAAREPAAEAAPPAR
jgi:ribonuclease P protein component